MRNITNLTNENINGKERNRRRTAQSATREAEGTAGVYNVEEFDPDPFLEQLNKQGLPWHEIHDGDLEL
ncbi:MAG: hypothetical protein IKH86_12380 [Prevotella sp.]|nr:hypothetical protein [Prevotella sp.]